MFFSSCENYQRHFVKEIPVYKDSHCVPVPMTRRGEQELDRDGEHVHEAAHPPVARHAGQGPGPAGPHRQPPPLLPQGQGQQPQGRTVEHETEIIAYLPTYLLYLIS